MLIDNNQVKFLLKLIFIYFHRCKLRSQNCLLSLHFHGTTPNLCLKGYQTRFGSFGTFEFQLLYVNPWYLVANSWKDKLENEFVLKSEFLTWFSRMERLTKLGASTQLRFTILFWPTNAKSQQTPYSDQTKP